MYRYYKYYSYQTTEAERLQRKRLHDLELAKLQAQTPRKGQPTGQPPFGLALGQFFKPVSRPYKTQGTQTPKDKQKTPQERIQACQKRVNEHISRVNAQSNIPAAHKTEMITRLNAKLLDCSTPHGLDKEEKDKDHKDADPHGYGRLVSKVTPGKLRQEPNILATLLQRIFDFFKNIANPPTPIQRVLENYPAPPYTTTTVPPRVTTS